MLHQLKSSTSFALCDFLQTRRCAKTKFVYMTNKFSQLGSVRLACRPQDAARAQLRILAVVGGDFESLVWCASHHQCVTPAAERSIILSRRKHNNMMMRDAPQTLTSQEIRAPSAATFCVICARWGSWYCNLLYRRWVMRTSNKRAAALPASSVM